MMRFSDMFIQQVAQATDIVELVGQYLALTKRGKEFVGLCPFHEDHKPSMYVSPAKQIFKCFACGAGGGVFQFLMLYEKLSFPEAVRQLAERAHIPLPAEAAEPAPEGGLSKSDLVDVSTFAARWFRDQLQSPAGAQALDYARKRGLTDESIQRFGLGYAPDSYDALLRAGAEAGYDSRQLLAAGLAGQSEGGRLYDRFRNRLMFPILETAGKVIAFGGRALAAEERAKYLNSPESVLFDKSSNLYALNWGREEIGKSGTAVVVEGYLDALMPHQFGVTNVVATLGTALTDRHVRLLSRFAREVVLIFDADAAGAAAAQRGLEVFLAQQVHVRVATIPAGKDPCDYVLAEGPDALRRLIAEAPDALQYIWQRRLEDFRAAGGNLADRRRVIEDFLRVVVSSGSYGAIDAVRRGQLVQHIAHLLNVPPGDLQEQLRSLARQVTRRSAASAPAAPSDSHTYSGDPESHVLSVLLNRPDLFDAAAERIGPEDFMQQGLRAVAAAVWALGAQQRLSLEELLACEAMAESGALVTELAT
ncbi:MAG TPA: DNA primase, partial [Phycisphaerae bacterium]|nr:DNA primase [Phycisphaerae bacterium]